MFQKQEYINKYIKENYRTIKFRIRKDDKMIEKKLEKVGNINHYIYDLIIKDIYDNPDFNFINSNISINFELSDPMKKLIKEAEEADLADDYGLYMNIAYAIDTRAKNENAKHVLTEGQWNKLVQRYCL